MIEKYDNNEKEKYLPSMTLIEMGFERTINKIMRFLLFTFQKGTLVFCVVMH